MPRATTTEAAAQLARILHAPLPVTNVADRHFPHGPGATDTIVTTCRLILVLAGELSYRFEQNHIVIKAGSQFFVPAWSRRSWRASLAGGCQIAWCEFEDAAQSPLSGTCLLRTLSPTQLGRERSAHRQLARQWQRQQAAPQPAAQLQALQTEAQLKTILARFWSSTPATQAQAATAPEHPADFHPEVKSALRLLEQQFAAHDILERLYSTSDMTPAYLRQLFRKATGCTPSEYIKRLRMRHARYLLCTTTLPHKRIAAETGYGDPLYFSRTYHRFWGHAPSEESR